MQHGKGTTQNDKTIALFDFPTEWSCYSSAQNERITVQKACSIIWYLRSIKLLGIFTLPNCDLKLLTGDLWQQSRSIYWNLISVRDIPWPPLIKKIVWDDLWSSITFHKGLKTFRKNLWNNTCAGVSFFKKLTTGLNKVTKSLGIYIIKHCLFFQRAFLLTLLKFCLFLDIVKPFFPVVAPIFSICVTCSIF